MVVGNACVVFCTHKWMRAQFVETPLNDKVKVYFVDYGTISVVNVSQCRFISKYFSTIPKLAYCGALEFIDPFENHSIELELVDKFCKLGRCKPLVGFVTKVDYNVRFVCLMTFSLFTYKTIFRLIVFAWLR